jgi:antirestriction protein ArdC
VRDTAAGRDNEDGTKRIPLLRAYTLFHASQIDGMPDFVPPTTTEAAWRAPDASPRGVPSWRTGAERRLNRDLRNSFGSHDYAREELCAEISTYLVAAELNLADCDFNNSAAYLASWLEKLRSDRKEIFRAAADAQRIADYLLAFHPEWAERNARSDKEDGGTEQDGTMSGMTSAEVAAAA